MHILSSKDDIFSVKQEPQSPESPFFAYGDHLPCKRSPGELHHMVPPTKHARLQFLDGHSLSYDSPPPTPENLARVAIEARDFVLKRLGSHFPLLTETTTFPTPEDLRFSLGRLPIKPLALHTITRALSTELHGSHDHRTSLVQKAHVTRKRCECEEKGCACPRKIMSFFRDPLTDVDDVLMLLSVPELFQLDSMSDYGPSDRFPVQLGHSSDTEDAPFETPLSEPQSPCDYHLEDDPLDEDSYNAAVMRGIMLAMERLGEVCQRGNVIAAICSPSTLVEAILFSSPDRPYDSDKLWGNEIAQAYLKYHPELLSFQKELREAKDTPFAIYSDLGNWFEALTPVRGLIPLRHQDALSTFISSTHHRAV